MLHSSEYLEDQSMLKVGSICSILAGILFAVSGIVFIIFLLGRFDWNSIASITQFFIDRPLASKAWLVVNWGASIASLLAIAGVLAITDVMRSTNSGLVRWLSTLAIIGYVIIAVTNTADYYQINRLASGYNQLDAAVKDAVDLIGIASLDASLNLRFVTLSPWFFSIGYLTFKNNRFPISIGYLGVIAGIGGILTFITSFLGDDQIILIAAVIAIVIHPIWLVMTGLHLGRLGRDKTV
ncbi:DUF4386 family protein [Fodinibius halophilus]|uniref:DUF4386 family protein n=1 Tax=Fodinibius halophilus TaxID=1736908 RepID=A0A6M1TD39_9BACT|nr:DUF4386 family protein [Fodinibius halophilus]NGP89931.1 DUF4386 family protein [Fodinibius halophilus]